MHVSFASFLIQVEAVPFHLEKLAESPSLAKLSVVKLLGSLNLAWPRLVQFRVGRISFIPLHFPISHVLLQLLPTKTGKGKKDSQEV
jgi:hypothetical protein